MNITRITLPAFVFFLFSYTTWAQEFKWFGESPEMMKAVEGRGWDDIGFNRLPDSVESRVRPPVWNLSRQTAGLTLRFTSTSPEIHVSYAPTGNLQLPHMPATGVSGVDLYTKDQKGNWLWVRGGYSFGEKVTYKFQVDNSQADTREYYLYLPLYNGVKGFEIGVPVEKDLAFLPARTEKPILIYGTSIAQGASASRPGMAWTTILARQLDMPLINLGFSGNGRMEPEV
ncbi:MAG: SGNH/GDSL hydrolase family protein, partial [Algoriphagus sp.]